MSWDPQGGSAAHRRDFTALVDAGVRDGLDYIAAWKQAADTMEQRGNQLRTSGGEDRAPRQTPPIEQVVRRFLRECLARARPRTSAIFYLVDVRRWLAKRCPTVGDGSFTRIMRKMNADPRAGVYVEQMSKPLGKYKVHRA